MSFLRVIDFETTGTEPPAEIIEVGYTDYFYKSHAPTNHASTLHAVKNNDPTARSIHHIRNSDLVDALPFDAENFIAKAISFGATGLVAHNADFELQWIMRELNGTIPMICTYKVSLRVWPDAPSHTNYGLLYWLEDQGLVKFDIDLASPSHRAGPDSYATAHLLQAIYNAGIDGKQMVRWSKEPKQLPTCPIGKFRGKKWHDVEHGFLIWMINQIDMDDDLKYNAQNEIDRRKAQ